MGRSNRSTNGFLAEPIRPRRAFEEVILQLRQAVADGRLAIGDRLPHERELAISFGVSRQSVREALRMLEGFGMLTPRRGVGPGSGWIVSGQGTTGLSVLLDLYISLQRIPVWDLLEIRESLEALSVRSAASRATSAQATSLLTAAQAMLTAVDCDSFLQLDAEFHVAIARRSGNTIAPLLMDAIREAMSRVMLGAFEALTDWPAEQARLAREHVEIAQQIQAGDPDAAADALRRHIRGFYGRALRNVAPTTKSDASDNLVNKVKDRSGDTSQNRTA